MEESERLPNWLRRPPGTDSSTSDLKRLLRKSELNTVCEEARCPNISECFSRGTATFMILGDVCTRGCRFCSVTTGKPHFPSSSFEDEAVRVAKAARELDLKHVVVTSVARDDLKDGGASGFIYTLAELRATIPQVTVEFLIPDLRGNRDAIGKIVEARPDVLNHNLETVPRLYRKVRPGASFEGSLSLLKFAKELDPELQTKTGIMLGLGETKTEVQNLMKSCIAASIDIFTAGQYMRPSRKHLTVHKYLSLDEFSEYQEMADNLKFKHAFIGPLVRSSYHAEEFVA